MKNLYKRAVSLFVSAITIIGLIPLTLNANNTQDDTLPALIITEISAFEPSGYEWLEIYNTSGAIFNVGDIFFYENDTKHKINIFGDDLLLSSNAYGVIVQDPLKFMEKYSDYEGKIFDSSWDSLKEDGEEIGLMLKADSSFFEKFTYISAKDNSLQRKSFARDYSSANWESVSPASPGQANITEGSPESSPEDPPEDQNQNAKITENGDCVKDEPLQEEQPQQNTPIIVPVSTTTNSGGSGGGSGGGGGGGENTIPSPNIVINEVSFKDPKEDFAELFMINDGRAGAGTDISGFSLHTDTPHFTATKGTILKTGEYLVVKIASPGFTGTTEQLMLKNASGKILDAVCWTADKVPESERKDMETLYKNNGWKSSDPQACIKSKAVPTGQSVGRNKISKDTDSASDFSVFEHPTPGTANILPDLTTKAKITIKSDELEKITTISINSDNGDLFDPETSNATELEKFDIPTDDEGYIDARNTTKNETGNGDLSTRLIITEMMPNPEGPDTEDEWIEIYNPEDRQINLGNWKLDDSEGGSKPYVFPKTAIIPKRGFIVISRDTSKIALNNSTDSARLFDYNGKLISQATYQKSQEGKSFALIVGGNGGKPSFQWTDDVTPGLVNPRYENLSGKVVSLTPDLSSAVLADTEGKTSNVIFGGIIDKTMAKAAFPENADVEMEVKRNSDGTFSLKKLLGVKTQLSQDTDLPTKFPWWLVFMLAGTIAVNIAFFLKNQRLAVKTNEENTSAL